MTEGLSFVTNATELDAVRLRKFLPAALRIFDPYIRELLVVIDRKPEVGRISRLHGDAAKEELDTEELKELCQSPKLRFIELDYDQLDPVSVKWFGQKGVNKCQDGTPIFAFLYGIESCRFSHIIRSDCDILFCNLGFMDFIESHAETSDVIQLPLLQEYPGPFSTRSFFINRDRINTKLPLQLHKLDVARRVQRLIQKKPAYLALEQIFEKEIARGKLNCKSIPTSLGYSMHITTRSQFSNLDKVIKRFLAGDIPKDQLRELHNYNPDVW